MRLKEIPGGKLAAKKQKKEKDLNLISAPKYKGFLFTLRPINNPYFENERQQREALQNCIDIIYGIEIDSIKPKPDPEFPIVRYDANIERKKGNLLYVHVYWIHGHVTFTFWDKEFTYDDIKQIFESKYHDKIKMIGEYTIRVWKSRQYNRQIQYIYKDSKIYTPWAHTLDPMEYGETWLKERMAIPIAIQDEDKDGIDLFMKNDDDRYKTSQILICMYALEHNLIYSQETLSLIEVLPKPNQFQENYNRIGADEIIETFTQYPHMNKYICLKKYIELILTKHYKTYLNDKYITNI